MSGLTIPIRPRCLYRSYYFRRYSQTSLLLLFLIIVVSLVALAHFGGRMSKYEIVGTQVMFILGAFLVARL